MTRSGVWLGLLLMPFMAWSGEAYRCTDAAGKVTFSDQPCGQSSEDRIYAPAPASEEPETLSATRVVPPPADDVAPKSVFERGHEFYNDHQYAEALPLLQKAAQAGEVRAYNLLGMIHFKGWGTKQNFYESLKWFRLAAESGAADGQANLGFQYEWGLGTPQDPGRARHWYEKAAAKDIRMAKERLAAMPPEVEKADPRPQPARSPYENFPPDIRRSMEIGDEARSNLASLMELARQEEVRQAVEREKSKKGHLGWVLALLLAVSVFVVFWLIKSGKGSGNRSNPSPSAHEPVQTGDVGLYTSRQAGVGTFLGGPLAGIYMLYLNFEAINEPDLAKSTLVIGGVCCLAMVVVLPFLPDRFPGPAFPVAYTMAMIRLMKHYQFDKNYIENSSGYACQSSGSAAAISLLGFVVLFVVAMAWMLAVS